LDPLVHLRPVERSCLLRFLALLEKSLGGGLRQVWLFGSAARGDMWKRHMPMNSDIDLLVITENEVPPNQQETLVNETYPLYLECGRQISPQFWSEAKFSHPPDGVAKSFRQRLLDEGRIVLPS
jgi:predicted nucleotidyltransferase